MSRGTPARRLPPLLLLLLLLPGAAAALLLLPDLRHRLPSPAGLLAWRAALAVPMIALPVLLALTNLHPYQNRAALGRGAGWLDRVRWIWLPRLGPSVVLSLLLAALFALGGQLRH